MTPLLLADVGNTRTKVAVAGRPPRIVVRDPRHDCDDWVAALTAVVPPPWRWAVTGSHPGRVAATADWVRRRGEACHVVNHFSQVPLTIRGPVPEQVGIDRLLDCCAANRRREAGVPAVVVDCGTAIVVNVIDTAGAFVGGAILPGYRAMLAALHTTTAALPRVEPAGGPPAFPATNTADAIRAGCYSAAAGGVMRLFDVATTFHNKWDCDLLVTGGDAGRFAEAWSFAGAVHVVEALTLEGLQLAAGYSP